MRGFLTFLLFLIPLNLFAYPDTERAVIDLNLGSSSGIAYDSENERIYVVVGEQVKVVELATFAKISSTNEPFDISSDDVLTGSLSGIAFNSSGHSLYVTQSGGRLLTFDTDDLTAEPTLTTLSSSHTLTKIAYDSNRGNLYILATDNSILRYNPSNNTLAAISLVGSGSFNVSNILFIPNISSGNGALYVSTDAGQLLSVDGVSGVVSRLNLDVLLQDDLTGIAALNDSSRAYVLNTTKKQVHIINTGTFAESAIIPLTENSALDSIVISDVLNPSDTYGFVMGANGLSVFDTGDNSVFDLGVTGDDDEPLPVSDTGKLIAGDNGNIYAVSSDLVIISDNPFVTISSLAYSGGGSTMAAGESVTLTFQSDEVGTYTTRAGGDTSGSGALLVDSSASSSGTVSAASSNVILTFNYNDNAALLSEGDNRVFIFVEDSAGNQGWRATNITVDTPPPVVEITSTSFGNEKIFVNINRLDVADIATYRVYVGSSTSDALASNDVAGSISQPSSGNVVVEVTGLDNGSTYFIAAEAVDSNGNTSASRTTTLTSGAVASETPEATFGPAGLAGEGGCTLVIAERQPYAVPVKEKEKYEEPVTPNQNHNKNSVKPKKNRGDLTQGLLKNDEHWSFEMRGGVFQPTSGAMKDFFGGCCNVVGNMTGGLLINSRYGIDLGAGFFYRGGNTRGSISGATAQEKFKFMMIPMTLEGTFRADFTPAQPVVPFVKAGYDFIFFHENDDGRVIKGIKHGLHGGGGAMFLLNALADGGLDREYGLNDMFWVIDGRYLWVNSFGGSGLDLSGWSVTTGFHLQF